MMNERDKIKEKAKVMASSEGRGASPQQAELWKQYRKLRNKISNRTGQEEIFYKKNIVTQCTDSPDQVWGVAKKFMD